MSRRLSPLPRVSRHPDALKLAIRRKRAQHKNTAVEERMLVIATAAKIRRELRGAS